VAALRELLPNAKVFVGLKRVKTSSANMRRRPEDTYCGPWHFSSGQSDVLVTKLGDSWLNLFDIFNLQLGGTDNPRRM
jgi:hypothetical protein